MRPHISYFQKSVCSKVERQQSEWNFDIGLGEELDLPIYVLVGFPQRNRLNNQLLENDSSYRPTNKIAHCFIETVKNSDACIILL